MNKSKYVPIILFLTTLFLFPAGLGADVHLTSDGAVPGAPFEALQAQIDTLVTMNADLQTQIDALVTENAAQQIQIDAQATAIAALQAEQAVQNGDISTLFGLLAALPDVSGLLTTFSGVSRSGNDIFFDGVNIHIRNGLGETDGVPDGERSFPGVVNGLGNLIIGYNEVRTLPGAVNDKTGSHNVVIGQEHNYSSWGGLVAGLSNTVSNVNSTVSGGSENIASGNRSSVSGGSENIASGFTSSVSGGQLNEASGQDTSVSGGSQNSASATFASISGGDRNMASGIFSSVSGGQVNTASAPFSSVSGGASNTAAHQNSTVGGGASISTGFNDDFEAGP